MAKAAKAAKEIEEPVEPAAEPTTSDLPRSALMDLMAKPISKKSPCGEEVIYSDEFKQIRDSMDSSLSLGGKIDQKKLIASWDQPQSDDPDAGSMVVESTGSDFGNIIALCKDILDSKSKDLRVACYLAVSLAKVDGVPGLLEGIRGVNELNAHYWEDCLPKVKKLSARRNIIQFLADRAAEVVKARDPESEDRETWENLHSEVEQLQAFLTEKMAAKAPLLSRVINSSKSAIEKGRVDEPTPSEPEPSVAVEGESGPAESAGDSMPGEVEVTQTADPAPTPTKAVSQTATPTPTISASAGVTEALEAMSTAAGIVLQTEPSNPIAYHVARARAWSSFKSAPPVVEGKTRIPGPHPKRRKFLPGLLAEGKFQDLVRESEASFPRFPIWLDLQRFIVSGMDQLGGDYEVARNVILGETRILLTRIPGLAGMSFSDGSPCADDLTQMWIDNTVLVGDDGGGAGGASGSSGGGGSDPRLTEAFAEAKATLMGGDLKAALDRMQQDSGDDRNREQRFRRQHMYASLCLLGQKPEVARPVLESLFDDIENHALDVWSPDLALLVLTDLHKCYQQLIGGTPNASFSSRCDEIFERICRIDPSHGLNLHS